MPVLGLSGRALLVLSVSALDHDKSPPFFNFVCTKTVRKPRVVEAANLCELWCFALLLLLLQPLLLPLLLLLLLSALMCCSCCFAVAALLPPPPLLVLALPFCFAAAAGCLLLLRIFQPLPFVHLRRLKSSHLICLKLVVEFLQRSIGIDARDADVNQSSPHSFRTSVPLVFALGISIP